MAEGEQGWLSCDCTRLPPMWLGFDLLLVAMCGFSLLLVLYSAPRGFFSDFYGLPLS